MMCILENPTRLANLLASIKVLGTNRPLSPIEVTREIQSMLTELDGDQNELARRLSISPEFIREFRRLLNLSEKLQDAVTWGESDSSAGLLGFSVAAKISRLKKEDQETLVSTMLNMSCSVTKEELKDLLSLQRQNPEKPMQDCLSEVLNVTRTVTVRHFMFVSSLNQSLADELDNSGSQHSQNDIAFNALNQIFPPGVLKDARALNGYIRLLMNDGGSEFITKYSQQHGILRQNAINHMLESTGLGNGKR